ncbi:MAG: xanthine dehydrogenase family protein molybdopterin-binding subunit [Candidatus Rokubacteria bacterium]|nr:xanthine dehydrogenase family protein molybdopterin-binding subunit [Candidatus Rokubacteria bacterium]
MGAKYFGASVKRREDPRYLTGQGRFVDDLTLPGLLYAAFLRSPHAHARIRAIHTDAARRHPGVRAVYTFDDLARWLKPLPTFGSPPPGLAARVEFRLKDAPQFPLARDVVRYVGETVALVVADSPYLAEDALGLIEVEYEPLPAVTDPVAGGEPGAALVHPQWGDNVAVAFTHAVGDAEAAFSAAAVVARERFKIQRYVGMPIEPRGVVASFDRRDATLTVWSSTQVVHFCQQGVAAALEVPIHKVRVVAPDVGGGFGTKACGYAEEILIPLMARELGRPVKWTETRREHMMSAAHARDQLHDVEIAATRDGTILGVRDRIWLDLGAYNSWGIVLPYNTVAHLLGPYRIRNLWVEFKAVVTNKTPNAPYRGAGRPETVFAMDRIVDCLARELRMDPAELRRRNFIRGDEMPYDTGMPYRDGNPLVYDSGDFRAMLDDALRASGYDDFRKEQAALRANGIFRGIGISAYVEGTGIGPYEGASVKLDATGRVVVATGACCQGQGHETSFAQLAADVLGVPIEWVTVHGGDTDRIPFGIGTFASRSAVVAGSAVTTASRQVREKVVAAAAKLLEARADDLEIEDGQVFVRGVPSSAIPLARVIQASFPTFEKPGVIEPTFEATAYHHVPTVTFASAVHIAQVQVDPETGWVRLLRYVVAHDCGHVINPMIVDGQIHGGVAQGIGGGMFEEIVYDEAGQLLSSGFMDYHIPVADELPFIETVHLDFPSPLNPLGMKGLGEGGAISPPTAIAGAVEDALAPFGVRITRTPVTPARLAALLRGNRAAPGSPGAVGSGPRPLGQDSGGEGSAA